MKQLVLHLPCKVLKELGCLQHKWNAKVGIQEMLDIAFSGRRSVDLAAQHQISVAWAMALRLYMSALVLASQNLLLGSIIMMASRHQPLAVLTRLAWDETGEKMTLGEDKGELSTWHVLVSRLRLVILWRGPSGVSAFSYVFILPPLVVPSTAAGSIWHSLFFSPLTGPLFHAVRLLRSKAQICIDLNESDGAFANDKLTAHLYAASHPTSLWEHLHCTLHGNQLIEVALMPAIGKPGLLSRLYSLTIMLHTAGSFQKMVRSLRWP